MKKKEEVLIKIDGNDLRKFIQAGFYFPPEEVEKLDLTPAFIPDPSDFPLTLNEQIKMLINSDLRELDNRADDEYDDFEDFDEDLDDFDETYETPPTRFEERTEAVLKDLQKAEKIDKKSASGSLDIHSLTDTQEKKEKEKNEVSNKKLQEKKEVSSEETRGD